ncbi:glucooligosaccharide oxidase [Aspergillus bertholletiae]|uniref:Glucooligosaccharide oxidase n=1 Tax=Aspergillus bertholletiae TaxID=1226010 RepID=A0A5N7B878_9EURO|nr:glucooligosaccharide oxidase [Aspergillus bertholletiae]
MQYAWLMSLLAWGLPAVTITDQATLRSCLTAAVDHDATLVALKGDLLYQTLAVKVYNLNLPVTPAAVTFPKTSQHVSGVVGCATAFGYKVQAKSGGHSYGNYGLGGTDGAIVVDLRNMKQFSYDTTTEEATVGGGMLNGELDTHLNIAGNRAVTHGTSPQIGIGGHATIGGLGPSARQWGMELDHVVEAEVVLANGSIVRASATQYQDVLFAVKGAGASFGVVTEFVLRTEEAPGEAVAYTYTLNLGGAKSNAALFKQWQELIMDPQLSRKFASVCTITQGAMVISGTYFGSKAEFDALGLGERFPGVTSTNAIVFTDWLGLVAHWTEQSLLDLTGGIPASFYSRCLSFTERTPITEDGIDRLFDYLATKPSGALVWLLYFDLEAGAINDVPMDATGYAHRDVLYWMQSYAVSLGPVSATTYEFLDGLNEVVRNGTPGIGIGVYPGYVDPRLENPRQSYWRSNLGRLSEIKSHVDPEDVFHNPQGVLPA